MAAILARFAVHLLAFVAYLAVVVAANWPLPAHLASRLPGPVTGDTGVYVWNLWLFRHEILRHHRFPLFTGEILSLVPEPVDLSLHNYTLFPDLLAFPLVPVFGVVATFNLIYLGLAALTAWALFALARTVIGRNAEAWLAGLLFGLSPVLVTRSLAHFSLTIAAPLPLFLLCLMRAERRGDWRYAAASGVMAAWAALCDPYYGVFCVLIGSCYLAARRIRLVRSRAGMPGGSWLRAVDAMLVAGATVSAAIALSGGTEFRVGPIRVQMFSLYTPMLLITLAAIARLWLTHRPRVRLRGLAPIATLRLAGAAGIASMLPLVPSLYAFSYRWRDGGRFHQPLLWRSSPAGVDALALFAPNPNHPWFGESWRHWLTSRPNGYADNVASITIVAVAVIVLAVWRYRFRPPRIWVAMVAVFGALCLGPFVHVGGINTFVPGPWALVRYVPMITSVRMPGRFAVVLMMAWAVLFGLALAHIANRHPARRRLVLAAVGLALLFELAPAPRATSSAKVPEIYQTIRDDPRNVRVLELPFGIRDGERSFGNFSAASQYYQTFHGKRLIGGYLSRVSNRRIERTRDVPLIKRLMTLSEGHTPEWLPPEELRTRAHRFLRFSKVAYVVVDLPRTPPELRRFAIETFELTKIGESDGRELYAVPDPTDAGP